MRVVRADRIQRKLRRLERQLKVLRPLFKRVHLGSQFAAAWIRTRKTKRLLGAAPALALAIPLLMCVSMIPALSDAERIQHYRLAAYQALHGERLEEADLCFRKLDQLGGESHWELFARAIQTASSGDGDEAFALMQQLAPHTSGGIGEAHLWIADSMMRRTIEIADNEQLRMLEHHFLQARRRMPNDLYASQMLAVVYRVTNRSDEAIAILSDLSEQTMLPSNRVRLATMFMRWGRAKDARREANRACRAFENHDDARRPLTATDYMFWARGHELLGAYPEAMAAIDGGIKRLNDDKLRVYYVRFGQHVLQHLATNQQQNFSRWLTVARSVLDRDEASPDLYRVIAAQLGNPIVSRDVEKLLHEYAAESRLAGLLNTALAELALSRNDMATARHKFEQSLKQDPQNATVANNLAWLYAVTDPMDLKRALRFADFAVKLDEANAAHHATRGRILVRMNRWSAAIPEFELALNGRPYDRSIHSDLANCYAKIGRADLAAAHRQQGSNPSRDRRMGAANVRENGR